VRIVLLEDEAPAMAQLRGAVLAAEPDARIEAAMATVAEARAWFAKNAAPDLVISDIILGDGNALSLFRDGAIASPVIFATAHDAFLLNAFRCASIDYLLKPIAAEDVARALAKYRRLARVMAGALAAVDDVMRDPRRRVLAQRGSTVLAVDIDDVACFVADEKLTLLITRDGRELIVDQSLNALERELDPSLFFRLNRATLAHVKAVRRFRSLGKGRIEVSLEPKRGGDGVVVVSQENGAAFRAWIDR
jgi:DNA-binding LytR/AlgR family response regulator